MSKTRNTNHVVYIKLWKINNRSPLTSVDGIEKYREINTCANFICFMTNRGYDTEICKITCSDQSDSPHSAGKLFQLAVSAQLSCSTVPVMPDLSKVSKLFIRLCNLTVTTGHHEPPLV